jgi:ribosomal protein L12E/L44/L45/RPP1/RPP2
MENQTFTPVDVVNLAVAKDAVKISAALDQMLGQRVYDAIQARRQEVAAQMFAAPVEASAEEEAEEQAADEEGTEVANTEQQPEESEESNETA